MYTFFLYALLALVILSVAMSLLGTYIVTRRQVFIAGGITHTCFGASAWAIGSAFRRLWALWCLPLPARGAQSV